MPDAIVLWDGAVTAPHRGLLTTEPEIRREGAPDELSPVYGKRGLSGAIVDVLEAMPEPLSGRDVAAILGADSQRVQQLVSVMARRGQVVLIAGRPHRYTAHEAREGVHA